MATSTDTNRHANCLPKISDNPNAPCICNCAEHRTNYQRACNCWNCENCGKRHSCHDWMTAEYFAAQASGPPFREETVQFNLDHIIAEGYKAFDNEVEYKDNPYEPNTQRNHFISWAYGWLQAYHQDNEGIVIRK